MERAKECFHDGDNWKWNIFTKNCEHFASYCATGESSSEQINTVVLQSVATGASIAIQSVVVGAVALGAPALALPIGIGVAVSSVISIVYRSWSISRAIGGSSGSSE